MTDNEIDEAVARKLGIQDPPRCDGVGHENCLQYHWPFYSTEIATAWKIVEFIKAKGDDSEYFCLEGFFSGKYHCQFDNDSVEDDTVPRVICRAFLKLDEEAKP